MKKLWHLGIPTKYLECGKAFRTQCFIFLLFGSLLCFSTQSFAQKTRLTINLTNVSLEQVFDQIRSQSQFDFFYSNDDLDASRKVSVKVSNGSLDDVLKQALGSSYTYKIVDKKILIEAVKTKKAAPARTDQPSRKIKGKVSDATGASLPGSTVRVVGLSKGVSTNPNGEFEIDVPGGYKQLEISFIGFMPQIVELDKSSNIAVTLKESNQKIDEVIVTGYQKVDRKLFTGSASRVNADDAKIEGVSDIGKMLEGRAAGVSVQSVSGTFGAAPKIRVRGNVSIYGDSKPLWVVDGVVLEDVVSVSPDELSSGDAITLISSAVSGLNPDDIDNFQILKDASATALYGARAMNGVIVVTTKKGHKGKTSVSYNGNFTTQFKPTYDTYNIMNSKDQMSVYRELERKGWLNHSNISRSNDGGVFAKMYDLINFYDPATGFGLENTPEARAKFLQKYEMANTNWFDLLFKNSFVQEHSISMSSGTDKSQFYVSTSIYNDNGWTIADKVKRYTGNFKGTFNLTPKITASLSTSGSYRDQKAPGTLKRVQNVVEGTYERDFDINPYSYALNTSRTLRPYDDNGNLEFFRKNLAPFNILRELERNTLDIKMLDLKMQADLSYKITDWLSYDFVGSMRWVQSSREHSIKEGSNLAEAYRSAGSAVTRDANPLLYRDPDYPEAEKVVVLPTGGFYNRDENNLTNFYIRNVFNINKTFKEKHAMNILLGQEIRYADRQSLFFNGYGYQFDKGGVPFVDYRFIKKMIEGGFNYYGMGWEYDRFTAFFSNAGYSYNNRYTVNGTLRVDGSNQLGRSRSSRWLPTWNISGLWNVHNEQFASKFSKISRLSLRAGYSMNANMGPARNSTLILRNATTDRPYTNEKESSIYIDDLENSELTWEKQHEITAGIDLGLFNNRLSITAETYQRKGFDLLGYLDVSGIGGSSSKFANYANSVSKGYDFSINGRIYETDGFSWTSNIQLAYNTTKITNLRSKPRIYSLTRAEGGPLEGYPIRGLFSVRFDGLDNSGVPTFINEDGAKDYGTYIQSDKIKYLKYEGPVDPTFTGGFSNTVKYKSWTLNLFISYQWGNKIRLNPVFKSFYSDTDALPKEFKDRWVLPGDEQLTNVPAIMSRREYYRIDGTNLYPYQNYNISDARVADGGFVRLKNISLTYDIPQSLIKKIGLKSSTLKVAAVNPWLIYADSKLKGQDPEFFGAGGVAMPMPKQLTLTLKLGL
ncbi:SusC/RagA family TonB-linked outer membrane protein [Alistipes sp. ZOR0009]|uniref:SusC/RagA family TonB-linked outer membrane protein n=1 Tax=Alistipes sp. ZOR0009 TaxID=1339253 RepID=UPI0009DDA584|nr:SusC/RagA family TonB-linked outer membrane protein [Alistipes sp. ZOR0009]